MAPTVTTVCVDDDEVPLESDEIVGFKIVAQVFCIVFEFIFLIYIVYNMFACPKRKRDEICCRISGVDKRLAVCMLVYHFSLFGQSVLAFSVYFEAIFGINGVNDIGTMYNCYSEFFLFIFPSLYFASFTIFWNLRLTLVFKGTPHETSKLYVRSSYLVLILLLMLGYSCLLIEFFGRTGRDINDAFCVESINIIDFFPYLTKNVQEWTDIDSVHENYFYDCDLRGDQQFKIFAILTGAIGVPLLNLWISWQYIRKMHATIGAARAVEDRYHANRNERNHTLYTSTNNSKRESTVTATDTHTTAAAVVLPEMPDIPENCYKPGKISRPVSARSVSERDHKLPQHRVTWNDLASNTTNVNICAPIEIITNHSNSGNNIINGSNFTPKLVAIPKRRINSRGSTRSSVTNNDEIIINDDGSDDENENEVDLSTSGYVNLKGCDSAQIAAIELGRAMSASTTSKGGISKHRPDSAPGPSMAFPAPIVTKKFLPGLKQYSQVSQFSRASRDSQTLSNTATTDAANPAPQFQANTANISIASGKLSPLPSADEDDFTSLKLEETDTNRSNKKRDSNDTITTPNNNNTNRKNTNENKNESKGKTRIENNNEVFYDVGGSSSPITMGSLEGVIGNESVVMGVENENTNENGNKNENENVNKVKITDGISLKLSLTDQLRSRSDTFEIAIKALSKSIESNGGIGNNFRATSIQNALNSAEFRTPSVATPRQPGSAIATPRVEPSNLTTPRTSQLDAMSNISLDGAKPTTPRTASMPIGIAASARARKDSKISSLRESNREHSISARVKQSIAHKKDKLRNKAKKESIYQKQQRDQIYRNGTIAIVSILSTICLVGIYSINTGNLIMLTYLDAILNGILMTSVLRFGSWIFDLFCIKFCCLCRLMNCLTKRVCWCNCYCCYFRVYDTDNK